MTELLPPVGKCRSCGDPVYWLKTTNGKTMPVNVAPAARGNLVIKDGVAIYRAPTDEPSNCPLYASHFATCKFAKVHRQSKTEGDQQ